MANLKSTSINVIKRTNTYKIDDQDCQTKIINVDVFFNRKNAFGDLLLIHLKCIPISCGMIRKVVLISSRLGTEAYLAKIL